ARELDDLRFPKEGWIHLIPAEGPDQNRHRELAMLGDGIEPRIHAFKPVRIDPDRIASREGHFALGIRDARAPVRHDELDGVEMLAAPMGQVPIPILRGARHHGPVPDRVAEPEKGETVRVNEMPYVASDPKRPMLQEWIRRADVGMASKRAGLAIKA